ncbi:M28 family metallopeptidase [Paludibaculum fermentans]|uniref:M28 family peptidase n=1 Tax=Paludibaculum fermentans TaxID=1473598 RepID=A0A7S7NV90_PALFE|nr:M28 family peptidase [Paludibaculum fermentans]QOY90394.1 M28 family peptidase [Paludibaculum fermentans]
MRLLLLILLAASAGAQSVEFYTIKEGVLQERLRLAHPKNPERYQRLKTLFSQSGCAGDSLREQKVGGSKEPNLICGLPGSGDRPRKIIVGAHFDAVGGDGIIDNWSGAVLLPSLYEFAGRAKPRHDFEFIGFAAEEKGLYGSKTYVKSIPKDERSRIAAVIIIDSIGLTSTKCWVNGSTKELVQDAFKVAQALKLDFRGVNVEGVGTTDSQPFKDNHIPVLCLHSVTQETWNVINGSRDVWSAVSWKDYYDTHRLISALIRYLDQTLP